jgi:hypothetical protein
MKAVGMNDFVPLVSAETLAYSRKKGRTPGRAPKVLYGDYKRRHEKVVAALKLVAEYYERYPKEIQSAAALDLEEKVVAGVALKRGLEYPGRKVLEAASQASTPGRNANIGNFSGEQSLNDLMPLIYNAGAKARFGRELVAGFLAGVMIAAAAGLLICLIVA